MGKPEEHAGLHDDDHGMQHHAAQVGTIRKNGRRQDEVQCEVVNGRGGRSNENGAPVAEGRQHGQCGKEIHMHVDLPRMAP